MPQQYKSNLLANNHFHYKMSIFSAAPLPITIQIATYLPTIPTSPSYATHIPYFLTSSPESNEMKRFLLQSIHLPVLSFCFLLKHCAHSTASASFAFITHCIVCLAVSVICDSAMWSALNEGKINKSCLLIYIFYYYSIIESKQCAAAECFGCVSYFSAVVVLVTKSGHLSIQ